MDEALAELVVQAVPHSHAGLESDLTTRDVELEITKVQAVIRAVEELHHVRDVLIWAGDWADGVEEKVIGYGYTDDGKDINGYYLTTENYQLKYNRDGLFLSMEAIKEVAQPVA